MTSCSKTVANQNHKPRCTRGQMYVLLEPLCGSARQPGHGIGKHRSATFARVYVRRQVRQNTWLQAGTLKALGRARSIKYSSCTSSPHIPHSREEDFTKASDVADRLENTSPMAGAHWEVRASKSTTQSIQLFAHICYDKGESAR